MVKDNHAQILKKGDYATMQALKEHETEKECFHFNTYT